MKRWHRWSILLASLAAAGILVPGWLDTGLLTPSSAECADPELCRPQQTRIDVHGYLRAVSLDVRGVAATPEEHTRVTNASDPEAEVDVMLDEWLATDAFADRVVRRHRDLLWPNISNVTSLFHYRRSVYRVDYGDYQLWYQNNGQARNMYRSGDVACLDQPAEFDEDGNIVTTPGPEGSEQEGYVMVEPYWAPGTQLRVCAFDAQTDRMSARGTDCSSRAAVSDPGCGCGPNMRWCVPSAQRGAILASFAEEMEQRVRAHVLADEPYHELLTSRRAFVNGPLTHYWRHQRLTYNQVQLVPEAMDVEALPDIAVDGGDMSFEDRDQWEEVLLPEEHSGLLTHPVFLLRFQTNRARANRFYDAFLCEPFQPPPGGIELDDEVAAAQPDVQQRPGCNYCHAILEPAAAHWGRWTQQGGGFLANTAFPEFRQECQDCGRGLEACSDQCRFNYVTRALTPEEEPYLGTLQAFQFLRDEHRPNVELGPAALVREGVADGRFTSCSVRRTAEWLVGRELADEEEPWVRELTAEFTESDFRYRDLVRAVVTSDTYRRAL
ncbi:MAG: DUF1585 domain-containing protein [Sandaracinaceae bacterium]